MEYDHLNLKQIQAGQTERVLVISEKKIIYDIEFCWSFLTM